MLNNTYQMKINEPFCSGIFVPTFKIPEGYSRTFVFNNGACSAVLKATEGGFHLTSNIPHVERVPGYLDWCQEVEQAIRTEIGLLPQKAA